MQPWFKDWFNSPYYHVLYRNRDESEAAKFIDNLTQHLSLAHEDEIWDLACGKGRHAVYLNKKGFRVVGTDLSLNNISCAGDGIKDGLEFYVHDMRNPFRINYFTYVLNLFTSIGYFEKDNDTVKVFKNVFQSLKPGGRFVIDFFNADSVLKKMMAVEEKTIEGITFKISKRTEDKKIIKRIDFSDKGKNYFFEEQVSLYNEADFENFGKKAGFKTETVFGDYNLNSFTKEDSERLIIIFKK